MPCADARHNRRKQSRKAAYNGSNVVRVVGWTLRRRELAGPFARLQRSANDPARVVVQELKSFQIYSLPSFLLSGAGTSRLLGCAMCGSGATFGLPPLSAAAFRLHASAQRIHEVDDLLLGVQSISERATVPPAWPKKHEQDHIKKLFWCFFGGGFFSEQITAARLQETTGLAQRIPGNQFYLPVCLKSGSSAPHRETGIPLRNQRPRWIPVAPATPRYYCKVRRLPIGKTIQNQSLA
jgi:hypothetical protein